MSKTFKSALIQYGDRTLTVKGHAGHVNVTVRDPEATFGATVSSADAPALALAILEAAGWPEDDLNSITRLILNDLRSVVRTSETMRTRREREAKEAADREALEALEAEALVLYNKVMRSGKDPLSEWLSTLQFTRIKYTDIARAARELHGGTK